jgi:plastocyanin domain-containing protein
VDTAEILVTLGGLLAIAGVIWYFFFSEGVAVLATAATGGPQEARVLIRGGYNPSVIEVTAGRPVRLHFYRDETSPCSDTVILGEWGISRSLPAHETTDIEFTPTRPGRFEFTCGMNMLRGTIVVREGSAKE